MLASAVHLRLSGNLLWRGVHRSAGQHCVSGDQPGLDAALLDAAAGHDVHVTLCREALMKLTTFVAICIFVYIFPSTSTAQTVFCLLQCNVGHKLIKPLPGKVLIFIATIFTLSWLVPLSTIGMTGMIRTGK